MSRNASHRTDHPRSDHPELPDQKGFAGGNLVRKGIPIPRGPTFQNVADIDLFPFQTHRGNDLGEQLPGPADERPALCILIRSGRLADENQFGAWVAFTKNQMLAAISQGASAAVAQLRPDGLQVMLIPACESRRPNKRLIVRGQVGEGLSQLTIDPHPLQQRLDQPMELLPLFCLNVHLGPFFLRGSSSPGRE